MEILAVHSKGSLGNFNKATSLIPVNDLRGAKSNSAVEGEQLLRCKLASLYRIVDLCGWSHGIYNHISVRLGEEEQFLLNPFGMLYSEITASSLLKVDIHGKVIDHGSSPYGVNKAGFTLHSAIHAARPDIKCVIHLHSPSAVAVSAMKCGFLPISQEAMICGEVSYHKYEGILVTENERATLAKDLGPNNKILILHNHGIVACGETLEEAFHFLFNLMAACEVQVHAVPIGIDNLVFPSKEARAQVANVGNMGAGGVDTTGGPEWKTGELEFEALMRFLDNSGYRTGYNYKMLPLEKAGSIA